MPSQLVQKQPVSEAVVEEAEEKAEDGAGNQTDQEKSVMKSTAALLEVRTYVCGWLVVLVRQMCLRTCMLED